MHHGTVEAIPLQQGVKFRISVPETVVDPLTTERTPLRNEPSLGATHTSAAERMPEGGFL
jgi:hypothetical protein